MNKLKILVVDDESRMRKLVRDFLEKQNFAVLEAGDGSEALDIFFDNQDIALIILDVMMPKMDGWQVCREVRGYSEVPIIMLTARSDERDELQGFELGVDEYISKPFSPKILVARVEAILRRTNQVIDDETIEYGGITIDKAAHVVSIDGNPIDLSYKEFELLTYFMENKGIALSREKILNSVWNYDYFGDARTIDTHVKKLRSKLGDKGDLIKTVWGMGYKLEALKYSIKQQIAGIFIAVMVGTIILVWFANSTFLEKYYISNKVHAIYSAYESLDSAVSGGSISSDEFDLELRRVCDMYNISVVVIDAQSISIKSTSRDTDLLIRRLYDNVFQRDNKLEKIEDTDRYSLAVTADQGMGTDYLEMWGVLDNGNLFLIRSPLESIRDQCNRSPINFLPILEFAVTLVSALLILVRNNKNYETNHGIKGHIRQNDQSGF